MAGLDAGGFLADLVLVPYADGMLIPLPAGLDPVAVASLSDNIPDGWRAVGPYAGELAALDPADRRVLVTGGRSIGLYAAACAVALGAHVDYVDTDAIRLAAAERLGAAARDRDLPDRSWAPYPVTVSTSARPEALVATLRATWPGGVCTCTSIFFGDRTLPLPLWWMYTSGVRFVTGRVNARADIPGSWNCWRRAPTSRRSSSPWSSGPTRPRPGPDCAARPSSPVTPWPDLAACARRRQRGAGTRWPARDLDAAEDRLRGLGSGPVRGARTAARPGPRHRARTARAGRPRRGRPR